MPAPPWDPVLSVTAPQEGQEGVRLDAWIQSQPGRFLQLRLSLAGRGRETPRIAAVGVEHDGRSPADHLSALFREDAESRRFLERYLGLAVRAIEPVEDGLRLRRVLFDPRLAPEGRLPVIAFVSPNSNGKLYTVTLDCFGIAERVVGWAA
jgi:hypothetical protein